MHQTSCVNIYKFAVPLTKEEEHICILCLKTKYEREARETLIIHNLRLVAFIADRVYMRNRLSAIITKEELISDGHYGLVMAASTFSIEKNTRFVTYAYRCIRNQMVEDLRTIKKHCGYVPLYDEATELMLENYCDIQYQTDPVYEYVWKKIQLERIADACLTLTDREKTLLSYRYYEENQRKREPSSKKKKKEKTSGNSQEQVAEYLGLSQSYVARLEKNVLYKIKKQANCVTIKSGKRKIKIHEESVRHDRGDHNPIYGAKVRK